MKRQDIVTTMLGLEGEAGHKRVLSVYNSQNPLPQGYKLKSSDAWCAATVTAVFLINGGCDFAECSCPRMITKAKSLGIWQESDAYKPQIGDVCFYDWQDSGAGDNVGVPDHVGIVIRSDDSGFVVREGFGLTATVIAACARMIWLSGSPTRSTASAAFVATTVAPA